MPMRPLAIALSLAATGPFATVDIPFLPQGPGAVDHLAFANGNPVVAGRFYGADDVPAMSIAAWDGGKWNALGRGTRKKNGNPADITSLHVEGSRTYICGDFDSVGVGEASVIAVWDGAEWFSMGKRPGNSCASLVSWGGRIHALFSKGPDVTVQSWSGAGWDSLPNPPEVPRLLAVQGEKLWVGSCPNIPGSNSTLAYRSDTGWTEPYGPLPGLIRGMGWAAGIPYATTHFDGQIRIMRWEQGRWREVGRPILGDNFMAIDRDTVYRIGENFATGHKTVEKMVADTFQVITNLPFNTQGIIVPHQGKVYYHGAFRVAAAGNAENLVVWEGDAWKGFTRGLRPGPYYSAKVLSVSGNRLIVGGGAYFPDGTFSRLGAWDGRSWDLLGMGIPDWQTRGFTDVSALSASEGNVFAGGWLNHLPDGRETRNIARWDGRAWHPLGEGFPAAVNDIVVNGPLVYVGGDINNIIPPMHGNPLADQAIGVWNGSTWSKVGSGLTGTVKKLAIQGYRVVAVGSFGRDSLGRFLRIAVWNGAAWTFPHPGDQYPTVDDVAVYQGEVYLAGAFEKAPQTREFFGLAHMEGDRLSLPDPTPILSHQGMLAAGDRYLFHWNDRTLSAWDKRAATWKRLHLEANTIITDMTVHQGVLWMAGNIPFLQGKVAHGFATWDPDATVGLRPVTGGPGKAHGPVLQRLRLPGGGSVPGVVQGSRAIDLQGRRMHLPEIEASGR